MHTISTWPVHKPRELVCERFYTIAKCQKIDMTLPLKKHTHRNCVHTLFSLPKIFLHLFSKQEWLIYLTLHGRPAIHTSLYVQVVPVRHLQVVDQTQGKRHLSGAIAAIAKGSGRGTHGVLSECSVCSV